MFFVSPVTKYRYNHSLSLANFENLFYHSKNQDGLPLADTKTGYACLCTHIQSANVYINF
ncbi:hypothetical protein CJP72_17675 [Citrobacter sp. NCU1]|nr:hypothetical protein [Citrobacter sp. NCU1]